MALTSQCLLLPYAIGLYFALSLMLSICDYRTLQLPDNLTLSLLWLGLFFHSLYSPMTLSLSVYGAIAGYLMLWALYWLYFLTRKREGLGYGDLKLAAAIGAWNGILSLPTVFFCASLAGILTFICCAATQRPIERLPFGPYLALAGWSEFVWQRIAVWISV